jgi:membrane-associated phospholipid phosphatase
MIENYSSPTFQKFLQITQSWYFLLCMIVLCTFSYFFLDRQIAYFMKYSVDPAIISVGQVITAIGKGTVYFIVIPILFLFFTFVKKNPLWSRRFLFLFLAIAIPSLLCNGIKMLLGRSRPELLFHDQLYHFAFFQTQAAYLSFPSGHSTLITGLMMGLCFLFTRYWVGFVLILLIISLSRVIVTAHFLSDTLAGMYLSILVVPWLYQKLPLRSKTQVYNRAKPNRPSSAPQI